MEEISNPSFEECLKAIPSTSLSIQKKKISQMRERLAPGEVVLAVCEGGLGFVAITDRRVILAGP